MRYSDTGEDLTSRACHLGGARTAFTLIELLVCMFVISVLCSMMMPALGSGRVAARMTACLSNQRQMLLAVTHYANDHGGMLVRSRGYYDTDGNEKIWTYALARYLSAPTGVCLCPERGGGELEPVYSEDWSGRDLINFGINRNLETQLGRADKWLKEDEPSWHMSDCRSPWQTWYFGDSFCGLRGFQCRLGMQVDSQSSFSTRHDGRVQLAFMDGHVEAYDAALLTDDAGITIADNAAGVWWFPYAFPPEWVVPQ